MFVCCVVIAVLKVNSNVAEAEDYCLVNNLKSEDNKLEESYDKTKHNTYWE